MKIKFLPFALALLLAPAAFAQDYEIKLNRPGKVGTEFNLEATGKQSKDMTATSNGAVIKNDKSDVTFQCSGVLKVLEVDDKQQESKTTVTIDKFTKTEDGKDSEVLPKGTVVTSTRVDKKTVHTVNGQPLAPGDSELFTMVVSLGKGDKTDDDTIFGTKERKKKGDSWDMNTEQAMKSFEEYIAGGKLENLAGKTTLDDVTGDQLRISAHFTTNFKPPLPSGFVVDSGSMEAGMSGLFPIDATKPRLEESTMMSFSFSAHGDAPDGGKIELKAKAGMESERKMTPK